jgi:hypothetical protein
MTPQYVNCPRPVRVLVIGLDKLRPTRISGILQGLLKVFDDGVPSLNIY